MPSRRELFLFAAALARGQGPGFVCPMDRDVRSPNPGKCPRCGMKLSANLPDSIEYRLEIKTTPNPIQAGKPASMEFRLRHPKTGQVAREFEVMHDKLFHLFLISNDLSFFAHEHPVPRADGSFVYQAHLPAASAYRVVADCFPKDATPQFLTQTIFTANAPLAPPPHLTPDPDAKQTANLKVELVTEPSQPIAGKETLLFFRLSPHEGVETYLSAWGHMLIASADLIDLIHDHPLYVDGVPPPDLKSPSPKQIQFNVIFPRPMAYRLWVQFQRKGVVNTATFTIPVEELK